MYMYINKSPSEPLSPLQAEFIKFILYKSGQKDTTKDGYYPMPYILAIEDIAKISE
jgi:phosphate transport system substrate-binding protein